MNMEIDIFADQPYGRIALKKLTPVVDNFRLFKAEWLGDKPGDREIMKVTGAEFRMAKTGKNAGKLCIIVKGTERSVYVTPEEMQTEVDDKSRADGQPSLTDGLGAT